MSLCAYVSAIYIVLEYMKNSFYKFTLLNYVLPSCNREGMEGDVDNGIYDLVNFLFVYVRKSTILSLLLKFKKKYLDIFFCIGTK